MAFLEYILLAFLGSTGTVAPDGTSGSAPSRTLDSGAIAQPRGGAMDDSASVGMMLGQDTGGDKNKVAGSGKKATVKTSARRHKTHHHRHRKSTAASGKKATKQ